MAIFYCGHGVCPTSAEHYLRNLIDDAARIKAPPGDYSLLDGTQVDKLEELYHDFIVSLSSSADNRLPLEWAVKVGTHVDDLIMITLDRNNSGKYNTHNLKYNIHNLMNYFAYTDAGELRAEVLFSNKDVMLLWFRYFDWRDTRLAPLLPVLSKMISSIDHVLGELSYASLCNLVKAQLFDDIMSYAIVHPNDPLIGGIFNCLWDNYKNSSTDLQYFCYKWYYLMDSFKGECYPVILQLGRSYLYKIVTYFQLSGSDLIMAEDAILVNYHLPDVLIHWALAIGSRRDECLDIILVLWDIVDVAIWLGVVGYDAPRIKAHIIGENLVDDFVQICRTMGEGMNLPRTVADFYQDIPNEYQLGIII